jgi:hypothetical protein
MYFWTLNSNKFPEFLITHTFTSSLKKKTKKKYPKQTASPRSPIPTSDHRCIGKKLAGQAPGMAEHKTQN